MANIMKEDLAAANREVKRVMEEIAALRLEVASAYRRGYRDGTWLLVKLSTLNEEQANMIESMANALCKASQIMED